MNDEQVRMVQRVIDHVFGDGAYKARLDEGQVAVDAWTISPGEATVVSIKGELKVPGYVLDVAVPTPGNWDEPPGVDVVEVMADRSLPTAILALVSELAKMRANHVLDEMATDAFVADWERDEREAKEYFSQRRDS
jgi:hypothetical protein